MEFTNHFLIAMPSLEDPNFSQTVTYICAHNADGAMGLVVNRPLDIDLGEVLSHMDMRSDQEAINHIQVYDGGPVQRDRGFVIHEPVGEWESMLNVDGTIGVSTSRDILAAIAAGRGPEHVLVTLGYAGWGAGQLEEEIAQNSWLSCPADRAILFELAPEQRWHAAAARLGVELDRLSQDVGHA